MTIALSPRWKPLAFTVPCTPRATPLYEPVIVQDLGLLIAAGALGVTIFAISKPQGIVASIRAKVWISGVAVNGGLLYIQDGPVLLVHSLARNALVAARNLVSGMRWGMEDDDPFDADALYALDAPQAALQAALLEARMEYAAALITGNTAKTGIALMLASKAAAGIDFSPPVVRRLQVDARNDAHVFSLRMDGTVYPLKDTLEGDSPYEGTAAAIPHLLLVERPQPSGNVLCHLFYIGEDGSIVVLEADGDIEPATGWTSTSRPVSGRVLPLRYIDGYLMGGGILGADFFIRPLDPTKPAMLTVAAPALGWRTFDVAVQEKLILLTGLGITRLVSYDPSAKQRDRWGERQLPVSHVLFWAGTGGDGQVQAPRLLIEMDERATSSQANVAFRVGVANTVDSIDPGFTSNYPPPFVPLENGTIGPGAFPGLANIAWAASRPVITNQTLYCVVRSTLPENAAGVMVLAAFSLDAATADLRAKAEAALQAFRRLAHPPRLIISRLDIGLVDRNYALSNQPVTIDLSGTEMVVNTDGQGAVVFDSTKAGKVVTPRWERTPGFKLAGITSATLTGGETVHVRITTLETG